ncbi:MAG: adenylate kinase, partial [Candidatus Didemnitutus sp.]|nr:adenylate kinase [Candidatus Didemnitutus sp.]
YHVDSRPPRAPGACDTCGSKLFVREDDQPDAVLVRQEAYQRNTAPLLEYYAQRKLLVHVDAHGTPEEVFARTITALGDKR